MDRSGVDNEEESKAVKERGFVSKAKFFRMAAMYFLDSGTALKEKDRTKLLVDAIKEAVITQYKGKKILTIAQQFKDI